MPNITLPKAPGVPIREAAKPATPAASKAAPAAATPPTAPAKTEPEAAVVNRQPEPPPRAEVHRGPVVDDSFSDADKFFNDEAPASPAAKDPAEAVPAEPAKPVTLADKLLKAKAPEAPPAAAAAPQAPEEFPEAKLEIDSKASQQAKDAFKNLKTITAELRKNAAAKEARLAEMEAKLKSAPTGGIPPEEAARIQEENKQLSDRLLVLDLQSHPSFKTQFTIPKQEQLDAAKNLLVMNDQAGVDTSKLLALPRAEFGKTVSEIAAKLPAYDAAEFSASMREAYKIAQNEVAATQKAGETLKSIQQGNQSKSTQAFERVWGETFAKATEFSTKWEVPDNATPEQVQKINEYNESLENISKQARNFAFGAQTEEQVSANAIKAAAYDHHVKQLLPALLGDHERVSRELHRVNAELAAIRSRNPNRENLTAPGAGTGDLGSKKLEQMSAEEAADATWGG